MKHKLLSLSILLMAMVFNHSAHAYYDFSSVASTGQTLYYFINYAGVSLVCPGGWYGLAYDGYTKPSGILIIPDSVEHNGNWYSVTAIAPYAFYNCTGLTSVTIPNSVTNIYGRAFEGCTGLTSVEFNADSCYVSTGDYSYQVFIGCTNLATLTIGNNVRIIPNHAFEGCTGLTSVSIPNSVINIGGSAFQNCTGLTSVTIGNSVINIGGSAFQNCTGLTSVTIPNSVMSIGGSAFQNCTGLTSVTIPDSVTSIEGSTFQNCTSLRSVSISNSVTSINYRAFYECTSLDTVYMKPITPPTLGADAFLNNAPNRVFVLTGCSYSNYYTYNSSDPWYSYRNSLREPIIDINFIALSNNEAGGIVQIHQQRNRNVRCDSTVVIQATANYGFHFDHWSNGNITNPDTLLLTGDSTVTAIFERNTYTLTVNVNDASLGSVSLPNGNTALYLDTLTVVASPVAHHHVASWQGQGIVATSAKKDTLWICMNNNYNLTCNLAIDTHSVTVTSSDIVRGMVEASGTEFVYGTPCTVTATAYTGYTFHHWSNGVTANPYTFAVMEDVELTAIFLAPGEETYTVTVGVNDPAMGNASANGNASAIVMSGETVTLTATANEGYRFVRWNDNNNEATRTITVTSDTTFTAFFEAVQGISDVQILNSAKIFASDGQIVVEGAEGEAVYMYDINGRLLATKQENCDQLLLDVPASGAYLVKIGNYPARKVVVIR